jgi:DHA2 family multidrug resistance protein-like MFS transporter
MSTIGRNGRTAAAAGLAAFTVILDNTKVNVALPTFAALWDADEAALQWIVQAYVLAFATPLLISGALTDRFGRRATLRAGLVAFAGTSAVAALAGSTQVLILARVLTGLAASLVMPATLAALTAAMPTPQRRARAVAGWTAVVALAVAMGPPVGGALLAAGRGWPILFWINVPLVLAAAAVLPWGVEPRAVTARLDVWGCLLLAGAVLGVVTAVTEVPHVGWTGAPVSLGAAAAVLCAAGCWRHQRHGDPVLPLKLFRGTRLGTATCALLVMFGALFGIAFLVPQYLQVVRGESPLGSGLLVLPYALALAAGSIAAGALPARFRGGLVVAGLAATAGVHAVAGFGLTARSRVSALVLGLAVIGLGIGLAQPVLTDALLAGTGARAGLGSALNDVVREVGGVAGVAVLGSIAAAAGGAGTPLSGTALLTGIRFAAVAAAALMLVATAIAHHLRRADAETSTTTSPASRQPGWKHADAA